MTLWLASMMCLAIAQRDVWWLRIILILAPMWTIAQVIHRFATRPSAQRRHFWRRLS
jgi:hypothetical protein